MGLGLIFSGQGHQQAGAWVGVGPAAAARAEPARLLQALGERLGPAWPERLTDAAWATANGPAQLLVTGLALTAWATLAPALPAPAVVAGYSVGELAAFSAAGVFSAERALQLAAERAAAMDAAVPPGQTGLLSVRQCPPPMLAAVMAAHGLHLAIDLGPAQAVVGGEAAALLAAQAQWQAAGVQTQGLPIALASHTPWMAAARDTLAQRWADLPVAPPQATLLCNLHGGPVSQAPALRAALVDQVARPVQWEACLGHMAERGVRCVLEIGPGVALARGWALRHPAIPARALEDFQTVAGVAAWVSRCLAG